MSHIDNTHFNDHHRRTARAILSHPVSHNIEWHDVLSLLERAGEVREEHNGKFKVTVGGETETLHRPRGKDVGEQTVVDLRRMLRAAGITVEGLRKRDDVRERPAAAQHGRHAVLLITYDGADIYLTDAIESAPTRIVPYDPRGNLRKMHHKDDSPTGWYGEIENSWYAKLADALRPAARILIVGNGKGHSNAILQFRRHLERHDHELLRRIVGSIETDREDLAEEDVLALARRFYGDGAPRDHGDGRWGAST